MMISAREYLHLAVRSSQEGNHQQALEQLYACIDMQPDNAVALFMLGAEHAELGLPDLAIEHLEKSIELDESIEMAHMQLGLIYSGLGRFDEAKTAWQRLLTLVKLDYLRVATEGLLKICSDDIPNGIEQIKSSMDLNADNAAFNESLQRIIDQLEPTKDELQHSEGHQFLGAYQSSALRGSDQ